MLYVKQKALALKEDVKVFAEEAQQNLKYQMKADKIIDFSAKYIIRDAGGTVAEARRERLEDLRSRTPAFSASRRLSRDEIYSGRTRHR